MTDSGDSSALAGKKNNLGTPAVVAASLCYSTDEESFCHDSLAEAIECLDDPQPGDVVYEGEAHQKTAAHYFDIDLMLENMSEQAYDDGGEWAEHFPELTKDERQELETLIGGWLNKHVPVKFWSVLNVNRIELTAEMIAGAQ